VDNCKRYPQAWRGHCRLQRRGGHGDLMASDSPEYPQSSPHARSRAAAPAVLSRLAALDVLSPAQLRWRVGTGWWQRPCPGVLVTHSGPLTADDALWVSLVWAGDGAVLAGLTAAHLDGLAGFPDDRIHVLVPDSRQVRKPPPGISVFLHRSRLLGADDVHPAKRPPRMRIARSLVDAAAWMRTDRGTQAVLAAGVQQRLVRPADLLTVVAGNPRLRRRPILLSTLNDILGGAEALSEIDFTRLVIRAFDCPNPPGSRCGMTPVTGADGWMPCGKRPGSSWRSTGSITWTPPSGGTTWTGRTASSWTGTWCCDSRPSSSGTAPAMSPPRSVMPSGRRATRASRHPVSTRGPRWRAGLSGQGRPWSGRR
jgi:hypothetical protein